MNYEGFYHLDKISGSVQEAKSDYIIRDHDKTKFEEKKAYALKAAELINAKYGEGVIEIKLQDSDYNMREYVEKHMELIRNAEKAMENLGVQPVVVPIRGGTDGAQLTYRGLVCPNLCAGKREGYDDQRGRSSYGFPFASSRADASSVYRKLRRFLSSR